MNHRLVRCHSCRATFQVEADEGTRPLTCPKCGAVTTFTGPVVPTGDDPEAGRSVFVAVGGGRPRRRNVRRAMIALVALVVAIVVGVFAWPSLRSRKVSTPGDPAESTATAYLRALAAGDGEASAKLGTVDLPPAIRSFRSVRRDPAADDRLKGSFAEIGRLHARIDERFVLDPASGRYTPRDTLGPAAEVLDTLHEAKAKAEQSGIYKKMQSGDPDDIFDAAEGLGKSFVDLAEGVLSPKRLVPTYKQLAEESNPPLHDAERALVMDFAEHRATWDAILNRPFATLKADGPFLLERAEVTTEVIDSLGSLGDPPTTLRLSLTRFRLEGIDSGWRVTSTRREAADRPDADASRSERPGSAADRGMGDGQTPRGRSSP